MINDILLSKNGLATKTYMSPLHISKGNKGIYQD